MPRLGKSALENGLSILKGKLWNYHAIHIWLCVGELEDTACMLSSDTDYN